MSEQSPLETERDGETVYGTPKEEQGSITFGSAEEYDKPYEDKEWLFHQYVVANKSTTEIADMVDVCHSTISNHLHDHNIPVRSISDAQKVHHHGSNQPWENEEWLRKEYTERQKPISAIADERGVSDWVIRRALREHGIERRSRSQPTRTLNAMFKDHVWLEEQYVEKGRSVTEIAEDESVDPSTISLELDRAGIETRSAGETRQIQYDRKKAVSKSSVPPREGGEDPEAGSESISTSGSGSGYEGPATGIDLSWSDSSDIDREKWVPYRNESWLRWQYEDLGKTGVEMAEECGISPRTIYKEMDDHGIDRRGVRDV